ncbi:clavaminate synthase-like protein At3g21360 [Selaginella moellendorffii]|nr:clavaminate synthase-like protein At3g21360 [Selaginella moellendorffii]|eukprot:XP_002960924.2 clavaminate synthase-like protein At3g21360 [Selaginella moellendorffii]
MVQMPVATTIFATNSSIPEQKLLSNSAPFPAVLKPSSSESSDKQSLLLALEQPGGKSLLRNELARSGAVLLRGFNLDSAADFDELVQRLDGEEFPYSVGGEATRQRVLGRVFTANDGIPLHKPIGFHNEVAYLPNSPSRIVFFCQSPAPQEAGGSTLVAHGRTVYEKLVESGHEHFLEELSQKGVRYSKKLAQGGHGSWKSMFQTDDKLEAEQRAEKVGSRIEWLDNDEARFISNPCPGVKINPHTGEKVWFNTIAGIQVFKASTPPGSFDAYFGDCSPFPQDALDACLRILDEEKVAFPWQKGDVLIVDNANVLHARQPSKRPRTVLVSLLK